MKTILTASFFLIAFFTFGQAQKDVVIHGKLNGDLKGYNKIYLYTRTTNDSATITNGEYVLRFPFKEPVIKYLYPQYIKEQHMMYQPFGILFSAPGDYYVVSDASKALQHSEVKGNLQNTLLSAFEAKYNEGSKEVRNKLANLYGSDWWKIADTSSMNQSLSKSSDSLKEKILYPLFKDLVSKHSNEIATAFALSMYGKNIGTIEQKEELFNSLSQNIQHTAQATDFSNFIQGLRLSELGTLVQNFSLPDPTGKPVDLKKFKGKYLLIDFWASWCWPCRNAFPSMRKMYKKYKGDQFEIYSISIDEDKDAWMKAEKEEANPWPQSWDDKQIAHKYFAVTAIPATFLLDPSGKIIAKEVGFDESGNGEIQKTLKKIFKKK